MECNREEALRAHELAEKKFASHDYVSAKKFAQKAQQLFPGLDNISQMLGVIDVHIAAQVKVGTDEKDWYRILQVDQTADDALVKKQYRKLALFLHPDKNKSIGAEAAFKLIGEAANVLSDKTKRMIHDAKRGVLPKGTTHVAKSGQNTQSFYSNGHPNVFNKVSGQHGSMPSHAVHQPPPRQPPTFWTACPSCQMRYQYLRTYENNNLLCPHCRRPFLAKDLCNLQVKNPIYGWPPQQKVQQRQFSSHFSGTFGAGFGSFNGFTTGSRPDLFQKFPGYADVFATGTSGKSAADPVKMQHGTATQGKTEAERDLLRKEEELQKQKEILKELRRKEKEQQKKARVAEKVNETVDKSMEKEQQDKALGKEKKKRMKKKHDSSSSSESEDEDDSWEEAIDEEGIPQKQNVKEHPRRSSRSRRNVTYKVDESDDDFEELPASKKAKVEAAIGSPSQEEAGLKNADMAKKKLADLAKNAIRLKLNLQMGKSAGAPPVQQPRGKQDVPAVQDTRANGSSPGTHVKKQTSKESISLTDKAVSKFGGQGKKESEQCLAHDLEDEVPAPTFSVPDSDFYNFDKGREEGDIKLGQIWALYDDKDGLPRYQIKVKEMHSYSPFKVTISWLEPRKPSEEQRELLDLGSSFACGEFRSSSSQIMDSVNAFSHIVKWEKGPKGIIKVYPRRGDVWGIYRDWEPGQQLVKVGDAPLQYNMVEVLTDFSEASGVSVALLNKVEGFKTVFKLSNEPALHIPYLELLRFSHQVPAHKLKGDEAPGISEGCWELDPASVPMSLIFPDSAAEKAQPQ